MIKNKLLHKAEAERDFHWSIAAMFIGLFIGIFTFAFIGLSTFISKILLSKVLAFFCFAGLLIPFRFYKKWFEMTKVEAALFNIMAVGPAITALLLWINFLVRTEKKTETIPIISAQFSTAEHFDDLNVTFTLENNAYEEYPAFRTISLEKENLEKAEAKALEIKTAKGALGYKVFLGNNALTTTIHDH